MLLLELLESFNIFGDRLSSIEHGNVVLEPRPQRNVVLLHFLLEFFQRDRTIVVFIELFKDVDLFFARDLRLPWWRNLSSINEIPVNTFEPSVLLDTFSPTLALFFLPCLSLTFRQGCWRVAE